MKDLTYDLYLITCAINGKQYVGITSKSVESRWSEHLKQVRHGSRFTFHNAVRKYGPSSFRLEILSMDLTREDAIRGEIQAIAYLKTLRPGGYNSTLGGDGARGTCHSLEARAKIVAARKNRGPVSAETRAKVSASLKGRKRGPRSEAFRTAMSQIMKGRKKPPFSAEHCAKISRSCTGRKMSAESVAKSAAGHRGLKHTAETKAKISAGGLKALAVKKCLELNGSVN